ncbi:MAG: type VI secretion system contractile sheath large subunit [Pirellulaceae bacterium]
MSSSHESQSEIEAPLEATAAEDPSSPPGEEPQAETSPESDAGSPGTDTSSGSLVDWMTGQPGAADESRTAHRWERFMGSETIGQALSAWLGVDPAEFSQPSLVRILNRDVAIIDELLSDQINAIIHAPPFKKLESAWRGLEYLTRVAEEEGDRERIRIRFLDVSWREVERDLERAVEFDSSELFKKIYENEFGVAGGKPFGAMIGNYEIQPWPGKDHPHRDVDTLKKLSGIAAAAFCPFIAGVSPVMFGLDEFTGLEGVENIRGGFSQAEFTEWNAFRQTEDARFVGLALPRVLMRLPYETNDTRADGFCFREEVTGRDRSGYLWGNAAFAFGEVMIRAFAQCGWLAQIRGVQRNVIGGGLVTGLPVHSFGTDKSGVIPKTSTDTMITDRQESELSNLGFLPLVHCHDTEFSAFYSSQTVQKPKQYQDSAATQNAKISSMLQYILCSAQFAHYLKVLARDKVGTFQEMSDLQMYLHNWIYEYVTPDDKARAETKASRPLRSAEVLLREDPAQPGRYMVTFKLWPHYQLDDLVASIRMKTTIEPQGKG